MLGDKTKKALELLQYINFRNDSSYLKEEYAELEKLQKAYNDYHDLLDELMENEE